MSLSLLDLLHQINAEVSKLSGVALAKLAPVLQAAEQEVAAALTKTLAKLGGDQTFTAQMYRNALFNLRGALVAVNQASPMLAKVLNFGMNRAGALAYKHLALQIEQFSRQFEGSIRMVSLEQASLIAEGQKTLMKRYHSSSVRYAGQVGEDIRKQLAIGVVKGETVDQMTKRLVRLGGPKGHVWTRGAPPQPGARGELIAEGLFRRYEHWAERLVVTETVHAYNAITHDGLQELASEDPSYKKRWDAAIDGRTCRFCASMDHEIADINGTFKGGVKHPPLHPRCRCAIVLWHDEWTETAGLFAEKRGRRVPKV